MTHHPGCANARMRDCECSECAGALHGWPSDLVLAEDSTAKNREAYRASVYEQRIKAGKRTRNGRPTLRRQVAGIETAVVDIIDWLAKNPDTIALIRDMGNYLAGDVVDELDKMFEDVDRTERRRALADHFWCGLLAGLAYAIADGNQQIDKIPDRVTLAILKIRKEDDRSPVSDAAVRLAIRMTWRWIRELLLSRKKEEVLKVVRILAVLICPAPERHLAVERFCLAPLTKDIISEDTKKLLIELFPPEWLEEVRKPLAS